MKVLASNDSMELLELTETESRDRPFMSHNKHLVDQRAEWTLRLIQSWGNAAAIGDIIAKYAMCEDHRIEATKPVPPQELVMRICEVVDAAWNEMLHRGWIIDGGSLNANRG